MRMDPGMLGVVVVTLLTINPDCWPSLVRTLYCIDWCVRCTLCIQNNMGEGGAKEDGDGHHLKNFLLVGGFSFAKV